MRAGLRVGRDRRPAGAPAALDRGRRPRGDRARARVGARDVQPLDRRRTHRRGLPRRRPDRPARQPQHHGDRPLRPAQGAPARRRRSSRDRGLREVRDRDRPPLAAHVRRAARLRHLAGPPRGAHRGDHRPGRAAPRRRRRAGARGPAPGRGAGRGPGGHRLAPAHRRPDRPHAAGHAGRARGAARVAGFGRASASRAGLDAGEKAPPATPAPGSPRRWPNAVL